MDFIADALNFIASNFVALIIGIVLFFILLPYLLLVVGVLCGFFAVVFIIKGQIIAAVVCGIVAFFALRHTLEDGGF